MDPKSNRVGTGLVGAPACGDVMKLQIEVDQVGSLSIVIYGYQSKLCLGHFVVYGLELESMMNMSCVEITITMHWDISAESLLIIMLFLE